MPNKTPDSNAPWAKAYREVVSEPYQAEAVRQTTIQILGLIAFFNGLLICTTVPNKSGGSLVWFDQIWGWPVTLGFLLCIFGGIQSWSVVRHHPRLAAVSCYLCAGWYFAFSAGFATQFVEWLLGDMSYNGLRPNVYPISVYLGLSALHLAQAVTIRNKDKAKSTMARLSDNNGETLSDG